MALDPVFKPVLDAVQFVLQEPGGIFMMAALTEENQAAEQLTIAPPSSMKLFRNAENKSELLNLGIAGNTFLRKKISPANEAWLIKQGWQKPQEPFNPYFSISGRGDLPLNDLLEFAVESWVVAFEVTPNTPIGMHLSLVDQNEIAARFLTLDPETFVFTIPGFEPNIRLEPAPPKKKRTKKPEANKTETTKIQAAKSNEKNRKLAPGDRATVTVADSNGKPVKVHGVILKDSKDTARLEVIGSAHLPDGIYALPWESLERS